MSKRPYFYPLSGVLLLVVAVAGWLAADYLGNNARQEIIRENRASALVISIHASSTLTNIEGAVKSLAGSPWIAPALLSKEVQDIEHANSVLDRYRFSLNASVSYLMDVEGMTVASSNRNDPDSFVGKSYRFRPYFQEAAEGQAARYFALGITSGKRGFYAGYPVRNHLGKVIGVVTMKKDLDEMETFFNKYPHCFLISPDGIVFLSSTPAMVLKSLWPMDKGALDMLVASQQFGNRISEAVFFKKEIADGTEVTLEGKDYFVSRKVIDGSGWSIVLLTPTDRIGSYKMIGILATISVCLLILIFSGLICITDRSKEVIRQSEEKYRSIFDNAPLGLLHFNKNGIITSCNDKFVEIIGSSREALVGLNMLDLPDKCIVEALKLALDGKLGYYDDAYRSTTADKVTPVHALFTPITSEKGEIVGGIGIVEDITDRKQAENALLESKGRFDQLAEQSGIMVWEVDAQGLYTYASHASENILGYRPEELVGRMHFYDLHPESGREAFKEDAFAVFDQKGLFRNLENAAQTKDGRMLWLSTNGIPVLNADGTLWGYRGSDTDITDRKQIDEKIRKMAYHDSLTGLPNRKLFSDRLGIAMAQAQRNHNGVAVTMLDLDNFKGVNDTLGHDVGDLLLKAAAERLSAALRKGDTVARFGGDEFVLILPDLKGIEDAIQVAQKIVESFRRPFPIGAHQLTVTTSIGVAVYPHDGTDEGVLLKNADIAMYRAKQTGQDRYRVFTEA